MYETSQFSRREFQRRFSGNAQKRTSKEINIPYEDEPNKPTDFAATRMKIAPTEERRYLEAEASPSKTEKPKKQKAKKKKNGSSGGGNGWDTWEI